MSEPLSASPPHRHLEAGASLALILIIFFRLLLSSWKHPCLTYLENAILAAILLLLSLSSRRLRLHPLLSAGLILYFAATAASIPTSLMPWSSLRAFLFQLGDLFLLFVALLLGRQLPLRLLPPLLAAGALHAAFALRQHLGGFARTLALPDLPEYARQTLAEGRVFGFTFSPDMLAAIMAGLLPLALAGCLAGWHMRKNSSLPARLLFPASLLCVPLFLAALFLTRSVGGLLAAAAGLGLWLFSSFSLTPARLGRRRFAALVGIFAALIITSTLAVMHWRGGHLLNLQSRHNPLLKRLDNWHTSLKVWTEFPPLGAGVGQYGLAMKFHRSLSGNEAKHVHNTLLEVLAETGPAGVVGVTLIFAAFFSAGLRHSLRRSRPSSLPAPDTSSPVSEILRPGFFAAGAAVILHSLIDFDWAVREVTVIFWAALATICSPEERSEADGTERRSPRERLAPSVVALALGITLLAELFQMEAARRLSAAVEAARIGDWEESRRRAEHALKWDKNNDETWALLTRALTETKPEADRTWAVRQAIRLNPRYPYHYRDLGLALWKKDFTAAGKAFRRAAELYPNSLELNLLWGRWLIAAGQWQEAEKVLLHARECHYENSSVLLELGRLSLLAGTKEKAREWFWAAAAAPELKGEKVIPVAEWLAGREERELAEEFLSAWLKVHRADPGRDRVEQLRRQIQAGDSSPP